MYYCEAKSPVGFVQQLAVSYVTNGYWFYVMGCIPDHKDPATVDAKIIRKYSLTLSKWSRCRRKKTGSANVQYLRFGRLFVLLATRGKHLFFEAEAGQIHDVRERPIYFMGYSIGCRPDRNGKKYHVSVRIHREICRELKSHFIQMAVHRSLEDLCKELRAIPFEPYAPVRRQIHSIVRAINRKRKLAGLEPIPRTAIRLKRYPVRPFSARQWEEATDQL